MQWALPLALMALVAILDLITGPALGMLPLLSLGPAFAAVTGGLRQTVITGAVALPLCLALAADEGIIDEPMGWLGIITVTGVTIAGVFAGMVRQRRDTELAEVRAVAEVAQQVLLRPVPAAVEPVQLSVRYMSAAASAQIGGDLYEVVVASDGLRLIIGDAQGKGLPAVKTAATVLGAFREAAYDAPSLDAIATRIELALARQPDDEEFVTAILAQVNADGSAVTLLNCGHPPPLLISADSIGFIEATEACLPLGLAQLADVKRELTTVTFRPGERILLYTDGISEARDRAGEFFPLARSHPVLTRADPEGTLDLLREAVIRHVGHALDDDAAMLLVCR